MVAETRPHIVLFNFGSIDQFTRYSKNFHFLMSRASEVEINGLESTMRSDMVGLEELKSYVWQRSPSVYFDYAFRSYGAEDPVSLIYPKGNYAQNAFEGILNEPSRGSKFTVDQNGLVFFTGPGAHMKDVLSVVSELCYLSQHSENWRKQTAVVPNFRWYGCLNSHKVLSFFPFFLFSHFLFFSFWFFVSWPMFIIDTISWWQ